VSLRGKPVHRDKLPREIDGVPVSIEESGPFAAGGG
jgi:hypothetical protein